MIWIVTIRPRIRQYERKNNRCKKEKPLLVLNILCSYRVNYKSCNKAYLYFSTFFPLLFSCLDSMNLSDALSSCYSRKVRIQLHYESFFDTLTLVWQALDKILILFLDFLFLVLFRFTACASLKDFKFFISLGPLPRADYWVNPAIQRIFPRVIGNIGY